MCLVLATVTAEWAEHKLAIFKYGHAGVHKHRKYLYTACTPNLLVFLEGDSFFSLLADIKRMQQEGLHEETAERCSGEGNPGAHQLNHDCCGCAGGEIRDWSLCNHCALSTPILAANDNFQPKTMELPSH